MKLVKRTDNYVVIDDFLPTDAWERVQDQLECESFEPVSLGDDKVYKLNSGLIYKSRRKHWLSKRPWENNYAPFADALAELLRDPPSFLPSYSDVSMMAHCYTAGSELSWHRDSGVLGGYTFYCHRAWHHMWGGNLMLTRSETPWENVRMSPPPHAQTALNDSFGRLYGARGATFDLEVESAIVRNPGFGEFVMPLPNRLVIVDRTILHKVERVDAAAGMNCRLSLTGFFTEAEAKS